MYKRVSGQRAGYLISLEGIDFTWKTPFAGWLKGDLTVQGLEVVVTRDPPYCLSPWDSFREFFERGDSIAKLSECFLLLTARLDNYERCILPELRRGCIVIADRYVDSWLAYQSVRLADYFGGPLKALDFLLETQRQLVERGLLLLPHLTILIFDDPEVTIKRAASELQISKYENLPMQHRVHRQYQYLARLFPERIKVLDARRKNIHEVYEVARWIVETYLQGEGLMGEEMVTIQTIQEEDKVVATRQISWTLYEFDDYPLVVSEGDQGTVTRVERDNNRVQIEWDGDSFKRLPKVLYFHPETEEGWPIKRVA